MSERYCFECEKPLESGDIILRIIDHKERRYCRACNPPFQCRECRRVLKRTEARVSQNRDCTREYVFCDDCNPIMGRYAGTEHVEGDSLKKPPSIEEMCGIDPDFTGGLGSAEYIRRMRGG